MLNIPPLMSIYILDRKGRQTLDRPTPRFQPPTWTMDTQITNIFQTVDRLNHSRLSYEGNRTPNVNNS